MSVAAVVHHLLPDASPVDHSGIVDDIAEAFIEARLRDPGFVWKAAQGTDLHLADIADGRVPDLVVVERAVHLEARRNRARHLQPSQAAMVVEITSRGNAAVDLPPPATLGSPLTERNGYARSGVRHCLLVDRDPRVARVLLYAAPDPEQGTYGTLAGLWDFGQTVELPEPFGVEISTRLWEPWGS